MVDNTNPIQTDLRVLGTTDVGRSQQGARRTENLNEISQLNQEPFQTRQIREDQTREFGGSRNPLALIQTGGLQINGAQSTQFPPLPEIGKGSITDSIV